MMDYLAPPGYGLKNDFIHNTRIILVENIMSIQTKDLEKSVYRPNSVIS